MPKWILLSLSTIVFAANITLIGRERSPIEITEAEATQEYFSDCNFIELMPACCDASCFSTITISHTEGRGLGYRKGYSTLGLFIVPSNFRLGSIQPFIDLRYHLFNDGKLATNLGVGLRFPLRRARTIVGINAYYDSRQFHHSDYRQAGLGIEWLGDCWSFRANGYIPVGKRFWKSREHVFTYPDGFFAICREKCKALMGADAEIERTFCGCIPCSCFHYQLSIAAGPYFYQQGACCDKRIIGGKVRVAAQFLKYLTVEVRASYDRVFHRTVQGTIGFTIPFGGRDDSSCCPTDPVCSQPTKRNEIMVFGRRCCEWQSNF